jgi:hypothetical protein
VSEAYRKHIHANSAWVIRASSGLYFAGFRDARRAPDSEVKWVSGLCDARLFGGNCIAQAEKYIERIKGKDDRCRGLRIVAIFGAMETPKEEQEAA